VKFFEKNQKSKEKKGMADSNEKKGDEYYEKAEKTLNKWSLFSGNTKYEEAAELFERAGNSYKTGKNSSLTLFISQYCQLRKLLNVSYVLQNVVLK
jgi:hypothetical protein